MLCSWSWKKNLCFMFFIEYGVSCGLSLYGSNFLFLVCCILSWNGVIFCQMVFCISQDTYVILILCSVNVIYYFYIFSYVKLSLYHTYTRNTYIREHKFPATLPIHNLQSVTKTKSECLFLSLLLCQILTAIHTHQRAKYTNF